MNEYEKFKEKVYEELKANERFFSNGSDPIAKIEREYVEIDLNDMWMVDDE